MIHKPQHFKKKMKPIRKSSQSLLLLKPFYRSPKIFYIDSQIHISKFSEQIISENSQYCSFGLQNSKISDKTPKRCNFGNTLLLNSTISEPNHYSNVKNGIFGSTQLQNFKYFDLNPEKCNLGSTQLCFSSKSMKTNKNPFFLIPYMSCLSNFSKPNTKTALYSSKFTPTRLFSSKPRDPNENSEQIDAGSSIRKPISLWPGMYHSPVTNALWEARSSIYEKPGDSPVQNELITKTPSQSRTSILYKFSSDYVLWEQYRNPWNEIRMGKLVEDLDALCGTISYKHCCNNDGSTRPVLLVTASVDKIALKKPIGVDADLTITGAVTWVGRSSMELQLEVTQPTGDVSDSSDSVALVANFTFVARDSKTGKSALVNRIQPETDRERMLWEEAEERNKLRKQKRVLQQKTEIDDGEVDRLNKLLAEGRVFSDMPALADRDSILMKDTCLQNSLICQPQQRNIHGRIFGGFLMRRAFELAFATAYTFSGSAPCFLEVDHVDFLRPVDVGDFLRLKSCVLYTELENPNQPLINVEVVAHVTRPEFRSSEVSNKFYFTFTVHSEAVTSGLKIRNVVPATEEEARRIIERMDADTS